MLATSASMTLGRAMADTDTHADLSALAGGARIDLQHHVILPEYERALARAGGSEDSWPMAATRRRRADARDDGGARHRAADDAALLDRRHPSRHRRGGALSVPRHQRGGGKFRDALGSAGFLAILPAPDVDGALAEMAHALDVLGADGVAFLTEQNGIYVGDLKLEPLYQEMHRRGVAAYVHPARPAYIKDPGARFLAAAHRVHVRDHAARRSTSSITA